MGEGSPLEPLEPIQERLQKNEASSILGGKSHCATWRRGRLRQESLKIYSPVVGRLRSNICGLKEKKKGKALGKRTYETCILKRSGWGATLEPWHLADVEKLYFRAKRVYKKAEEKGIRRCEIGRRS